MKYTITVNDFEYAVGLFDSSLEALTYVGNIIKKEYPADDIEIADEYDLDEYGYGIMKIEDTE